MHMKLPQNAKRFRVLAAPLALLILTGHALADDGAVAINAKFPGKIDFIAPNLDPQSGLLRVKVLVDNAEHVIKAYMKGWADFGK